MESRPPALGWIPAQLLIWCVTQTEDEPSPAHSAFINLSTAIEADTSLEALTAKDLIEMEYLGTVKTFGIQITGFNNDISFFT